MANKLYEESDIQDIATAIRGKNGSTDTYKVSEMASAIESIETSPASPDIMFYDYEGTLVESWTLEELAAATELPELPTHTGLTCQGWNWTLADLKTTNRKIIVGATYITDDGKTRLYIKVTNTKNFTLYYNQSAANGVTVDWGDESAPATSSTSGNTSLTHTYTEAGDYVITLLPADGTTFSLISNSTSGCLSTMSTLQKVELGSGITQLKTYAFIYARSLESITIPNTVTYLGSHLFEYCNHLKCCILPINCSLSESHIFSNTSYLSVVGLPNGITTIPGYTFQRTKYLDTVTLPDSITTITTNAFLYSSIKEIVLPSGANNIAGAFIGSDLNNVTLEEGIITIGQDTFSTCKLKEVTLPSGVTTIGKTSFYMNYYLESITIPDSVTSIGTETFCNCDLLKKVILPANLNSISSSAFSGCAILEYDFSKCTSVPTLVATSAFTGILSECIMKIPTALFSAWSTATNWSTYASKMVAV